MTRLGKQPKRYHVGSADSSLSVLRLVLLRLHLRLFLLLPFSPFPLRLLPPPSFSSFSRFSCSYSCFCSRFCSSASSSFPLLRLLPILALGEVSRGLFPEGWSGALFPLCHFSERFAPPAPVRVNREEFWDRFARQEFIQVRDLDGEAQKQLRRLGYDADAVLRYKELKKALRDTGYDGDHKDRQGLRAPGGVSQSLSLSLPLSGGRLRPA